MAVDEESSLQIVHTTSYQFPAVDGCLQSTMYILSQFESLCGNTDPAFAIVAVLACTNIYRTKKERFKKDIDWHDDAAEDGRYADVSLSSLFN